mgnify:FL=1
MEVFFYIGDSKLFNRMKNTIFFLCFSSLISSYGQHITVLDSLTQAPIPFVHVFDGTKGVIASAKGTFFWEESAQADSLTLSCMGFALKKIAVSQLKDSLYLLPKTVELTAIVVSNRVLSGKEILERVIQNTAQNMDFGLSSSEVFTRTIESTSIQKMNIEINKSTIKELDQSFVDEILQEVPKKNRVMSFSRSKWLRDNNGLKLHKLEILQAANLQDSLNNTTYSSIEETMSSILKKRVKKDSYFKVKSGPFIRATIENNFAEPVDSITKDSSALTPKQYAKRQLGSLQLAITKLFEEKSWTLPFLVKSRKYSFVNEGVVYDLGTPTFKVRFTSTNKKDYSGYLLVDVEDFGVRKISYQSNEHIKRIKLFGLFYELRLINRSCLFVKNQLDKYRLYYLGNEYQTHIGLKRPIKVIEKNKIVKGRNRQNMLSMDLNMRLNTVVQQSIYFNSFTSISKEEFDAFTFEHTVTPTDFFSLENIRESMPSFPTE